MRLLGVTYVIKTTYKIKGNIFWVFYFLSQKNKTHKISNKIPKIPDKKHTHLIDQLLQSDNVYKLGKHIPAFISNKTWHIFIKIQKIFSQLSLLFPGLLSLFPNTSWHIPNIPLLVIITLAFIVEWIFSYGEALKEIRHVVYHPYLFR